jgi:cytochrome d ubiquinol oxidase subunit II
MLARFGLPELLALVMLGALVVYALTGGADFGGGLWDLLAWGPRAPAQRRLIESALAPVWEANHVWLIFVVVILFSAFPPAYAALTTALHLPLTLMLVGIVLRGSAFVFRQYGGGSGPAAHRWGQVFAVASVAAPFFLGTVLAAITQGVELLPHVGRAADDPQLLAAGLGWQWTSPFALLVGALALALFAFLAAVYLTVEAPEPPLAEDFRRRALAAGVAFGVLAFSAIALGRSQAPLFHARLLRSWWSWPLQLITGALAVGALLALWRRRYRLGRALAIGQCGFVVLGWGLAQYPHLIAPDLTIRSAAAPSATLRLLVPALAVGGLVLLPSLYYLLRIFKRPLRP